MVHSYGKESRLVVWKDRHTSKWKFGLRDSTDSLTCRPLLPADFGVEVQCCSKQKHIASNGLSLWPTSANGFVLANLIPTSAATHFCGHIGKNDRKKKGYQQTGLYFRLARRWRHADAPNSTFSKMNSASSRIKKGLRGAVQKIQLVYCTKKCVSRESYSNCTELSLHKKKVRYKIWSL